VTPGKAGEKIECRRVWDLESGEYVEVFAATAIAPHSSEAAYEASLRRSLDRSRREKRPDHEETLAHLVALAVDGKTSEAHESRGTRPD